MRRSTPKATPEWRLQAAAVTALRRAIDAYAHKHGQAPFLIAGDMNAGRRSLRESGIAKVTGMEAGEPDLRVYLPGGRLGLIEYKTAKGRVSPAQKFRHARLAQLGHDVAIVKASDEADAAAQTMALVDGWLGDGAANDNLRPDLGSTNVLRLG